MKNIKVHFTSSSDNYSTPNDVYKSLDKEFNFDFDPCPLQDSPLFDGLQVDWGGGELRKPSIFSNKTMVQKSI